MMRFCFILVSLLFSVGITAQNTDITIATIDKKFEEAKTFAHGGNPEKAIPILYQISEDCEQIGYKSGITKVGHTLAIIYFNSADYNKVITLDDQFLRVGKEIQDYEKLCHIHRLKACAYSELGLPNRVDQERKLSLKYGKLMKDGNAKQHAISLLYGNLANHYMKIAAPKDSIFHNILKGIEEAEKIDGSKDNFESKKSSLIAYSYMTLGDQYSEIGEVKKAEEHFLKALQIHETKTVPLVEEVVLFSELGYFYLEQKEYQKAVKYAEMGLEHEKRASFPQLRRDLFETLSKSYLELQKTSDSKHYLELFTTLSDSIVQAERKTVNTALSTTISNQAKQHLDDTNRRALIYGLSGLVLLASGIVFFLYYKKKKQKQIHRIEAVLEQLRANKVKTELQPLFVENVVTEDKKEALDSEEETMLMSAEAEEKLLEKLHSFEAKKLFLERKVSLSYVAAEIESNTKYLSYIIKKHKGKDFNKYINDLRISYIVQKINDEPKYRLYKINALAEETGFSSHSKFATIFKNTVGVSPSEFIKYFEGKEDEDKLNTETV